MSQNRWDSSLYDENASFVSDLGMSVIELLDPKPGEKILDLGCGTGDLTYVIAKRGALPFGIDSSNEMLQKAKEKYPGISFAVDNAEAFRSDDHFDAVFSNACLHWIKNASAVVESIWLALRPVGRFVAEFGGKGNVETIIRGIETALGEYDIPPGERNPWYYPSIGEYSSLLEQQGFRVTYAIHFDRPTPLKDGEYGFNYWLDMFAGDFFVGLSPEIKSDVYRRIKELVKPVLFKQGTWVVDYRRIRLVAIKNGYSQ